MKHLKYSLAVLMLTISSSVFAGPPEYQLPNKQWRIISLPAQPPIDANTVEAIFGDELSANTYDNKWVLFSYEPDGYKRLEKGSPLEQGKGYWIIQITGNAVTLNMPSNSIETSSAFEFGLEPTQGAKNHQWNLAGNPFSKSKALSDFSIETNSGACSDAACSLDNANNEKIVHGNVWRYEDGYQKINGNTQLNAWEGFWCAALEQSSGLNKLSLVSGQYGKEGPHNIGGPWQDKAEDESFTYYPSDISTDHPTPVVFFVPGWKNTDPKEYETLLKFIASQGISVIYAQDIEGDFGAAELYKRLKSMAKNPRVLPYIDTSRIGVMGFSSGGGHAFKILHDLSATEGWGENGRFLFAMEPWFAFDMNKTEMQNLPSDTNIIFTQFGEKGFNVDPGYGDAQDPRIVLSEYYLLGNIPIDKKDYQIVTHDALSPTGLADHRYPTNHYRGGHGNVYSQVEYSEMQGILKPLDALIDYTFRYPTYDRAHKIALEVGDDDPYGSNGQDGIQIVKPIDSYGFPCGTKNGINYCDESNW